MRPYACVATLLLLAGSLLSLAAPFERPLTPAEKKALAEHVRATAKPLDWSTVAGGEERVVMFGEDHNDNAIRQALIDAMPTLRAKGITHLGMESLRADDATLIEHYNQTGEGGAQILASLRAHWSWEPESYFALIEAAHRNGIRIVPLDVSKKTSQLDYFDRKDNREPTMAGQIEGALESVSGSRVMVLAGDHHIENPGIASHLKKVKTKRYDFLSNRHYLEAVKMAGVKGPTLYPASAEDYRKHGFDGYLVLPQILAARLQPPSMPPRAHPPAPTHR